jgi:S-formylglutathione hydrolase FrmB
VPASPFALAPLLVVALLAALAAVVLVLLPVRGRRAGRLRLVVAAVAVAVVGVAGAGLATARPVTPEATAAGPRVSAHPSATRAATPSPAPLSPAPVAPTPGTGVTAATVAPTPALLTSGLIVASDLDQTWVAPPGMPARGREFSVAIPGTTSHFAARPADVYLPPAALVANAPALPVVVLLSGQPASPDSVMTVGSVVRTEDALAAKDRGLAPIVVVPDQLGKPQNNPMCVDGPLGNSSTYILGDVTAWVRSHLHVLPGRDAWAVGGYSEGGTCAIQFATARPDIFGSFIDVSGERYPTMRTDKLAIRAGFRGSVAAYDRAKPENILRQHGPYLDEAAIFAVGATDAHYGAIMSLLSAKAAAAGMTVARYASPRMGHSWTTAGNGFASGIGALYPRFGLAPAGIYLDALAPPAPAA